MQTRVQYLMRRGKNGLFITVFHNALWRKHSSQKTRTETRVTDQNRSQSENELQPCKSYLPLSLFIMHGTCYESSFTRMLRCTNAQRARIHQICPQEQRQGAATSHMGVNITGAAGEGILQRNENNTIPANRSYARLSRSNQSPNRQIVNYNRLLNSMLPFISFPHVMIYRTRVKALVLLL